MDGLTPEDLATIQAHRRMVEGLLREWETNAREGRVRVPTPEEVRAALDLGTLLMRMANGEEIDDE